MNTPHNTNRPFETIIEQIKTAVDFSDAGKVPYTPEQVVTMSYDLIFVTGYFTDTCLVWKKKWRSKNWAEFKIYFAKEHCAWKDMHPMYAGVVYSRENSLVEAKNMESETIDDIVLLAADTASDWDTYFNLLVMVAFLMSKLVIANKNLMMALK